MGTLEKVIVAETIVCIGGIEFSIKPPTLLDWSYFINAIKDLKKKDLISTYQQAGKEIDITEISAIMLNVGDAIGKALEIDGLSIILQRMISRNPVNPKITTTELLDKMTMKDIKGITDIILSSLPEEEKDPKK
jgi:hypothetical protein